MKHKPTRDHRPCPKCGATTGRSANLSARCLCGAPLRARVAYFVECRDCSARSAPNRPLTFISQPWISKESAAHWWRTHNNGAETHRSMTASAVCDCGWSSDGHVVWASLDESVRNHRHREHTT